MAHSSLDKGCLILHLCLRGVAWNIIRESALSARFMTQSGNILF
jgi:hypothetical protein